MFEVESGGKEQAVVEIPFVFKWKRVKQRGPLSYYKELEWMESSMNPPREEGQPRGRVRVQVSLSQTS